MIAARRICCHLLVNIANQESWKNDNGDYETRTEWLEGTLRYREVEDEVKGTTFKHRITEVHATGMKRLSKIEGADDPQTEPAANSRQLQVDLFLGSARRATREETRATTRRDPCRRA